MQFPGNAAPFVVDRYILSVLLLCLIGAYLGQAWNILMGFAGYPLAKVRRALETIYRDERGLADPEAARTYVEKHGARFVLICPGLIEVGNYRQAAPHGLMARLIENRAPAWLRPVALPRNSGLMLWEVAPAQPGTKASASPFMQ